MEEEELVLDEVQLTAAILNASKAIDNFFMNGFNEQFLLNSGITSQLEERKDTTTVAREMPPGV